MLAGCEMSPVVSVLLIQESEKSATVFPLLGKLGFGPALSPLDKALVLARKPQTTPRKLEKVV